MHTLPIVILFAFLIAPVAQAAETYKPKTSRGVVMAHECSQIDQRTTGFSCHFNGTGLLLRWHVKHEELPPARQSSAYYEFDKIALRYLELGGGSFSVMSDYWPAGKERVCASRKRGPRTAYLCRDYSENDK